MSKTKEQMLSVVYEICRRILGDSQIVKVAFDAEFIADNVITINVNSNAWQTDFITDDETTKVAIIDNVMRDPDIKRAYFEGNDLFLEARYSYTNLTIVPTVTGGIGQPSITTTDFQEQSLPVLRYADQAAPIEPPVASIRIMGVGGVGHDNMRYESNVSGSIDIVGYRTVSYSIDYIGENAIDEMMKLYDYFETDSCQDYLDSQEFGFVLKNNPQNLTNMLETDYEERSNLDFTLSFAAVRDDKVDIIESVELEGTIDDEELESEI